MTEATDGLTTIGRAIALLRWWADDASDDPRVLAKIRASVACADDLDALHGWLRSVRDLALEATGATDARSGE